MSNSHKMKVSGIEQDIELDQLLDFDMGGVEVAFGGFDDTPAGLYHMRVESMGFEQMGKNDEYLVVQTKFNIVECFAIKSEEKSAEDMAGKTHIENQFIKTDEDLKLVMGLLSKLQLEGPGKLKVKMAEATGRELVVKITHSRNKDDPDKPWVNMDIKGAMTLEEWKLSQAA